MSPEEQVPYIDLEKSSIELSPPQDSKFPIEPFTLNQQTIDRLTQELAQSTSQNKRYAEMIADLHQENKDLRLQVKIVEELDKSINSLHDSR